MYISTAGPGKGGKGGGWGDGGKGGGWGSGGKGGGWGGGGGGHRRPNVIMIRLIV